MMFPVSEPKKTIIRVEVKPFGPILGKSPPSQQRHRFAEQRPFERRAEAVARAGRFGPTDSLGDFTGQRTASFSVKACKCSR
jgi:hypothetical protein